MLSECTASSQMQWETIDWSKASEHLQRMQKQLVKHYREGEFTVVNLNSKNARHYVQSYRPLRKVDARYQYSDAVRALLSGVTMRKCEQCEGKLSRTVLWGEGCAPHGESAALPA